MEIKRPVFFSGENPLMTLYHRESEKVAAVASYWHCTDSPHGTGHVLVLWLGSDAAIDPSAVHGGIYTDNTELAKVLVNDLTRYFPEFKDIPAADLEYKDALCNHNYEDGCYRVNCMSGDLDIVIKWIGVLDRKQIVWPDFPAGPKSFDLTTVICPCRDGSIRLNGRLLDGKANVTQSSDGLPSSSAFLAFAETWIGPMG